jgi:NAD(P)H-nitrite reductase large subunit
MKHLSLRIKNPEEKKRGKKMTRDKTDYLIIGNSAAGLSAAESIRTIDKKSMITVLCEESHFNYSKPLISYYLGGKIDIDKTYFKDKDFYSSNDIELKLESKVEYVDSKKMYAKDSSKKEISFYKLLISSGGRPIIPDIKVIDENIKEDVLTTRFDTIENAFNLTTLDDAISLKKYVEKNHIDEAIILGGGLIGLKTAEAFLELKVKISIIELADRILSTSFDTTASEIISEKINQAQGKIFTGTTIDSIYTEDGKITGLKLSNSDEIPCKLLVVAIGVNPETDMIKDSGIKMDRGIMVDEHMKTSMDNIYAAGDVVKTRDMLSGLQKNIAIWPLAVRQGRIAGINMAGGKESYSGGFFMNSVEILGVPVVSIGLSSIDESTDKELKIYRQHKPESSIYRKIIVKDNHVIGAILVGSIERAGIYAGLINNKVDISGIKDNIAHEDFGIIQLPADYKKHLVIGDGIEV